ncbi:MAG: TIGR00266 family protein [Cyanobacteria bacterium J06600_6]
MECEIKYKPAFSAIFVTLEPGEKIIAESGAMATMDGHVTIKTELSGSLLEAIAKKFFGGESLFINTFSNETKQYATLVLTQSVVGDIEEIEIHGKDMYFQPGAYIASTPGIKLGVRWAGFTSWFAGEGLFKLRLSGKGKAYFGAYGGITKKAINGEFIVDTGHLVAYEPGIEMGIKLSNGLIGSLTSGEGFVNRLTGRGNIYLQSRSIGGLVGFLRSKVR